MMNIIITNIGRRGYLVDYFKDLPDFVGKVYVSDCDKTASGLYGNNDGHFLLPKPVNDEILYVKSLIKLCKEKSIYAVLPVIDPEIFILSKYREDFIQEGITVIVSDRLVLDICFDKLKMNNFLAKLGVAFPKTYATLEEFEEAYHDRNVQLPVVLKPILGSGSVDTYFVDDLNKVRTLYKSGMMIQEKLNGTEYGTDTFNSFDGKPLRCVIKKKLAMRSGETDKSVSVHNNTIQDVLILIAKNLKHIGNLDCDIIVSDGVPCVIDMNPRFGGGYPATHAIGINLIALLFKLLCGKPVEPEFGKYEDDILVMKEIAIRSTKISNL